MEGGDPNMDDKGSTKSSSPEDSPRMNIDGEKDEYKLSREIESLNANTDEHELHGEVEQEGSDHKVVESGSDSVNLNKMSHSTEEVISVKKDNDSDSDNQNNVRISPDSVERSGSDTGRPNKTSHTSVVVTVKKIESDSDSEELNKMSENFDKVDEENGPDSDNLKIMNHTPDKAIVEEKGSDSDTERPNNTSHATEGVHAKNKESDSDSESMKKNSHTTEKVEKEIDSDSDNANIKIHNAEEIHDGGEESGSNSGSQNRKNHATLLVHVVNKGNESDSEKLNRKRQPAEKAEKDGDSDSEKLNKMSPITKDVLVEEKEMHLATESVNEASLAVDEVIEVKEVDPVFDGTEALEMDARRVSPSQSLDTIPDSQASTWPEKAAAIKNLVRMKGAIAVSNVFRRLSGGKDDAGSPDEEEKNVIVEGQVEEPVMKGRIILYTRLGCQESKEIRTFMRQKGLNLIELNVDIYPGRKLELEKNTGSSAVPRVYLNDFLVGGLSELKAMAESAKFDEKINELMNEEPSTEAPLPPLPGEDDVSASGKVDELASIFRKMKESIVLSDRFYKLRRFNDCFVGSEAVDFLSREQDLEREEAINLGRKLVKGRFFRHVLDENIFEDGNHLYRFLENDPSISTNCFNMTRGINELKPKRVTEIASRLRFLSFSIFEAYVSEDGRHVDYKSIHGSEEFKRYLRIIEELQRVELDNISREEKLAFFINLYNMMAIHAILAWGYPNGAMDRKKFLGEFKYVVGGCPYSLSAIQNGILRGNQRPPYNISKPFGPRDMRFKVALPYAEPLIHFALVCGTRSGPPLRCYSPGNIDMELMEAARVFLRTGGLLVDAETKTASASSIIRWYSVDFGRNDAEVMRHLSNYLEPSKSQTLLDLLADNQLRVTYQAYDWGSNC